VGNRSTLAHRLYGDEKFYFFGRNCGLGEAMSVSFVMQPDRLADTFPITRLPKTGRAGWGVGLTAAGEVTFRLGSHAEHRDVVARAGYRAGVATRVTCALRPGTAAIYLDGKLHQRVEGLTFAPTDATAPGRLGANSGLYDAVRRRHAHRRRPAAESPPLPKLRRHPR